jgi:peptidoglycan/xylan/chitin deacetylase (PgdA/CDA1 family)
MARDYKWPGGKRIAVAVTAMLETWSEGKGPPYGVQASPLKPGITDYAGIAWGSYGGKVGVYRLIRLFKDNGIPATFAVNGRCAEIYPDAVKAIVASGHDVAGHGWYQDQLLSYLAPEEERAVIARSLDILERTAGVRPAGWISPSMAFTEHTRGFLAEQKLMWHGDARDSDLPRLVDSGGLGGPGGPGGEIVHIPGSDFTDNRVLRSSSMDLWDVHTTTFDYLYHREAPAFMALTMHCHFGGRPMIAAVMDKVFKHIAKHPQVWLASFADIAKWVRDNRLEADPRRLLGA